MTIQEMDAQLGIERLSHWEIAPDVFTVGQQVYLDDSSSLWTIRSIRVEPTSAISVTCTNRDHGYKSVNPYVDYLLVATKEERAKREREPAPQESPKRRRRYPWSRWENGDTHIAVQGEDFDVPLEQFRVMVHGRARRLGGKAYTTTISNDPPTLAFAIGQKLKKL